MSCCQLEKIKTLLRFTSMYNRNGGIGTICSVRLLLENIFDIICPDPPFSNILESTQEGFQVEAAQRFPKDPKHRIPQLGWGAASKG